MTKEQRFIAAVEEILDECYYSRHTYKGSYDVVDMHDNFDDGILRVKQDIREALYRLKIDG